MLNPRALDDAQQIKSKRAHVQILLAAPNIDYRGRFGVKPDAAAYDSYGSLLPEGDMGADLKIRAGRIVNIASGAASRGSPLVQNGPWRATRLV